MPKFLVLFSAPVVDQPDHEKARKVVTQLPVSAATASSAFFHAARVTRGDGHPVGVYDVAGIRVYGEGPETIIPAPPTPPQIEVSQDRTEVFGA